MVAKPAAADFIAHGLTSESEQRVGQMIRILEYDRMAQLGDERKIASTYAIEQILDRDDIEVAFLTVEFELEESDRRDFIDSRDICGGRDHPEVQVAALVDDGEGR